METHKIASEHKNTGFYCEGGQTLAQVAQRRADPPSVKIIKTQLDMVLDNLM